VCRLSGGEGETARIVECAVDGRTGEDGTVGARGRKCVDMVSVVVVVRVVGVGTETQDGGSGECSLFEKSRICPQVGRVKVKQNTRTSNLHARWPVCSSTWSSPSRKPMRTFPTSLSVSCNPTCKTVSLTSPVCAAVSEILQKAK
jgi:hypothetical protein